MSTYQKFLLVSSLILSTMSVTVLSDDGDSNETVGGFDIDGYYTIRLDHYDSSGPRANSTLPFEGQDAYGEIGINFYKQDRPYARWRGQIYGVANGNDYRSVDKGIVPERLNLTREVGDSEIPYRVELGDYFSYFSYMTQQRSLKGIQLEFQPGFENRTDSFIFFAGSNESSWQELTPNDDYSIGSSYLLNNTSTGAWSFNTVFNSRDSDTSLGLAGRDQIVTSASWQNEYTVGHHNLVFEGEAAHFMGDHNGSTAGASGEDRSGTGYFFEFGGDIIDSPLDYRFRAERYNKDFRPRGAVVTPDRRSLEGHAGWQFNSGILLKGRLQAFDDAFQSSNELETRTAGINLNGPILGTSYENVTGIIDAFAQQQENELKTIDRDLVNITVDFNAPLPKEWYGQFSIFTQIIEDHSVANIDNETWQVSLSGDHDFEVGGFNGVITPGILLRLLRGGSPESDDIRPTIAFNLNRDAHSVGFNYGLLTQDRNDGVSDIVTQTMAMDYRYERGQNTFGAELSFNGRDPDPGSSTDDWTAGVYWTHSFDWPAKKLLLASAAPAQKLVVADIKSIDVYNLAPGLSYVNTVNQLVELGLRNAYLRGNAQVWEYRLLPRILQRQRLAVVVEDNEIEYSALIIDFENVGNVDSVKQLFDRVQKALIDKYGSPTNFFEDGEFTSSFVRDVNRQELIRIYEWQTQHGKVRFGIPRRLDGKVRMEVQHRRKFGQPRDTLWSLEEIR
jgi:hypothetical protein